LITLVALASTFGGIAWRFGFLIADGSTWLTTGFGFTVIG
jgi:hypothetical protein